MARPLKLTIMLEAGVETSPLELAQQFYELTQGLENIGLKSELVSADEDDAGDTNSIGGVSIQINLVTIPKVLELLKNSNGDKKILIQGVKTGFPAVMPPEKFREFMEMASKITEA